MRYLLLISGLLLTLSSEANYISIADLVSNGKVRYHMESTGIYSGTSLKMDLQNLSGDTIWYFIEPGRIMLSSDTTQQNLLIVKAWQNFLAPRANASFKLTAYCSEATDAAPRQGLEFKIGPMAPESWIRLAENVNVSSYPVSAVQSAVWVLSDNHPVSSVGAENLEDVRELRQLLADLKNIELPWYHLEYEKDSVEIFSGRHRNVYGVLEFNLRTHGPVSIVVRDEKGTVMTIPEKGRVLDRGSHKVKLSFRVADWPKGDYFVYVYQDQVLNQRKHFRL